MVPEPAGQMPSVEACRWVIDDQLKKCIKSLRYPFTHEGWLTVPQLSLDVCATSADSIDDLLPASNLLFGPNTGSIRPFRSE
jgi:hypothetical protein